MKLTGIILAAIFLGAGAIFGTGTQSASASTHSHSISISAANWAFSPAMITVHVHKKATLELTSKAGIHGLQSTALGIPQTVIVPGKTETVTFVPTKVGTYILHCTVPCGTGHAHMTLVIKVV